MENNERFRNELASKLLDVLPPDKLREVLKAVDLTSTDYDISRKPVELITTEELPEVVKFYLASKAVENLSKKTLSQYRYKLINFFSAVRKSYADIAPNDIRLYLYGIKQTRNASDRYLDNIRITLHGFFDWLVCNDYLLKNPCDKVEHIHFTERQRDPLTPYELEVFRDACETIREKALVDFLFSTGCRVSECSEVRLSDIDFNERSVLIRHGKGNKPRTVYFNAESELTLRKYLSTRSDATDALFVSVKVPYQPIGAHAIENVLKKISERAGMHVYPHKLRHTFATSGLRGGMPLDKLQALMGHENPETTLIYAKQCQQNLQLEHRRIYA